MNTPRPDKPAGLAQPCPDFVDDLTAYRHGELEGPALGRLEAHLAGACAGCRATLRDLARLDDVLGRVGWQRQEPSAALLQRLAATSRVLPASDRVVADPAAHRVVRDSRALPIQHRPVDPDDSRRRSS